jgi:hypothetical protein
MKWRREEPAQPDPQPRWADELAEAIRQFAEPLRPTDRRERITLLLAAVTEHYRSTGEREPDWLVRARILCSMDGDTNEHG